MRAKVNLVLQKDNIKFYDQVKSGIEGLAPLRTDPQKTREYINQHLFLDVQFIACNRENNLPMPRVLVNLKYIRSVVRNILKVDDSFVFAYNILTEKDNDFINMQMMQAGEPKEVNGETLQQVRERIRMYREDYPKDNLADFLLVEENRNFYRSKKWELSHDEQWWLEAFNRAYAIFDEMRLELDNPFKAKKWATELILNDKLMQHTVVQMLHYMTEGYDFELNEEQLIKMSMLAEEIKDFMEGYGNGYNLQERYNELLKKYQELEKENERLLLSMSQLEKNMRGMPTAIQCLVFYYIFNYLGVNFENSVKEHWIRFIEKVTGKNAQNIKKHLKIDFDCARTQQNLRIVHALFLDLFPNIAQLVVNDMKAYS